MNQKLNRTTLFSMLVVALAFVSCKKVGDDTPVSTASTNSVFSYFVFAQYAFESPALAELMSSANGATYVATKDSTLVNWARPEMGCTYAVNDTVQFEVVRSLNVGDMEVNDAAGLNKTIKANQKFTFAQSSDFVLTPGVATVTTTANNPEFSTQQEFTVLETSSRIGWRVEDGNTQYEFPSPKVVEQTDPQFEARLKRGSVHTLDYSAPAGTTYVKAIITDGIVDSAGEVVCYGEPLANGSIRIPSAAFNHFEASSKGSVQIDFVAVDFRENGEKINQSIVLSYKRNVHGYQIINVGGQPQAAYFGALYVD